MSGFPKPDPDSIPDIANFIANPRPIPDVVKEVFLKYHKQSKNIDYVAVEKVQAIINHLSNTCKTPTVAPATKTSCARMKSNYETFLQSYLEAGLRGGRRKTSKGRRKQKNKSRRNRKSRR